MSSELSISQKLEEKLNKADPDIYEYVIALYKKKRKLEIENMKLHDMVDELSLKVKEHSNIDLDVTKLSKEDIIYLSDLLKKLK